MINNEFEILKKKYNVERMLPCLQSIGPWWSLNDRMFLYRNLHVLFGLPSEFFEDLSVSTFTENGEEIKIKKEEIANDFARYKTHLDRTPTTCRMIEGNNYSFGCFNKRICSLCPYSSRYANNMESREKKYLYYYLKGTSLVLSEELENMSANIEDVFKSYYPVYMDNILVDAYPISMFAKYFLPLKKNEYNSKEHRELLLSFVSKLILKKTHYIKNADKIEKYYPDYKQILVRSADVFLDELDKRFSDLQPNYFRMAIKSAKDIFSKLAMRDGNGVKKNVDYYINRPMIIREADENKENEAEQKAKEEAESFNDNAEVAANLENPSAINKLSENMDTSYESVSDLNADNNEPLKLRFFSPDSEKMTKAPLISERFLEMEGESLRDKPLLNDELWSTPCSLNDNDLSDNPALCDSMNNTAAVSGPSGMKAAAVCNDAVLNTYQTFYPLSDMTDIYVYGKMKEDSHVFSAFIQDSSFLCMEPVIVEKDKGVLIMNQSGEMIFMCLAKSGYRTLKKTVGFKIPVYTSNLYNLCKYLFKHRCFNLNIKDVGIALSINTGESYKGISDFKINKFPAGMKNYRYLYEAAVSVLTKYEVEHLERLQRIFSFFVSDGSPAPFENMPELYTFSDSVSVRYQYVRSASPVMPGVYFSVKATSSSGMSEYMLHELYMNACMMINSDIAFASGNIRILFLGHEGLMFFITGDSLSIRNTILFVSGCIRKVFSSVTVKYPDLKIAESVEPIGLNNFYL